MTATPLAMGVCGLPFGAAASVMQTHVIAMFAPSFFTGRLIQQFGEMKIMLCGCTLAILAATINLSGSSLATFYGSLIVLGVAWNFLYVGGTTLLGKCYRSEKKGRVQGLNDLLIFLSMISSSFSSGVLVSTQGWAVLNHVAIQVAMGLGVLLLWQRRRLGTEVPSWI